jgi:hypothetical protein
LQYCSCPTSFLGTEFAAAYRPNAVDFKMKYSSLTRTNLNNSFFSLQVRFCCGKSKKVSWTFENFTTRGYQYAASISICSEFVNEVIYKTTTFSLPCFTSMFPQSRSTCFK